MWCCACWVLVRQVWLTAVYFKIFICSCAGWQMCCVTVATRHLLNAVSICQPAGQLSHRYITHVDPYVFLHISHLFCFLKCSNNTKAISVHNMYCCFHAIYTIRHASNIYWPPPADIELNLAPALNGLWSNICSGTLSWFVSWLLLGLHKIVTRRGDRHLRGLRSMISTISTDCKYRQVQQWWIV